MLKKLKFIFFTGSILTIRVMATQFTPDTRSFSNVWTRQAALRAAPVKETIVETLIESNAETSESQLPPVNLATAFEEEASDDTGFVTPSAEKHAANLARMERQATRASQPRAPRVTKQKVEVQAKPKQFAGISAAPSREKVMAEIAEKLERAQTAAPAASAAAAPAAAAKQQPPVATYTIVFDGKVTSGLTYERLHKATKVDLLLAQEMVYNQFIEAFENALKNDGLLQCVDHLSGGFQTRKLVDGKPIVAGKHTFLMSDIIKERYWVRKTREALNDIEPRLHVSFYFDQRTSKGVLSMKKA